MSGAVVATDHELERLRHPIWDGGPELLEHEGKPFSPPPDGDVWETRTVPHGCPPDDPATLDL